MEETENTMDKDFKRICEISSNIFEMAKKKMMGEKVKVDIENKEIKQELQKLLNSVNFINEIEAKRLVSETILDLDYITNPEVKVLSLRLGKIYREQKKNDE